MGARVSKLRTACIGLILVAPIPAPAAQLADFFGRWQGQTAAADAGVAVQPSDLDVEIQPASNGGFIVRWTELRAAGKDVRRQPVEARFAPTERPNVFAFTEDPSLLASLFASPDTGNPLAGDQLLWARIDGDTLIVYSLALDPGGGFVLHRDARTLDDGGLAVLQTVRTGAGEPLEVVGRLVPGAG